MEIEIDSKRNNPLLKRTEIYFTVKHEGEGTPNREIIKSELAEKLNVKKESIIVSSIDSSFGVQQITGYAKVYSSDKKSKDLEPNYLLKRNKLIGEEKKGEKKEAAPAETEAKPAEPESVEKPAQPTEEQPPSDQQKQEPAEEKPEQKDEAKSPEEKPPDSEPSAEVKEEPKEAEPQKSDETHKEPSSEEKADESPVDEEKKEEQNPDEKPKEKKE
jgi:ribosomal protein S24E